MIATISQETSLPSQLPLEETIRIIIAAMAGKRLVMSVKNTQQLNGRSKKDQINAHAPPMQSVKPLQHLPKQVQHSSIQPPQPLQHSFMHEQHDVQHFPIPPKQPIQPFAASSQGLRKHLHNTAAMVFLRYS